MEEWKLIDFEPNYEISNFGRIRNFKTKRLMKFTRTVDGYLKITLYPSWKCYRVNRLVGLVWLSDSYSEGLVTDHINGVRDDNRVENLEWVTVKENNRRIKNKHRPNGESNPSARITEKQAYYIKYSSFDKTTSVVSKEMGVDNELVRRIRVRELWTHVLNEELESKFLSGSISYPKDRNANLTEQLSKSVLEAIILGEKTSVICNKFGVGRGTVARYRNKLRLEDKPSTTIESITE